MSIAALCAAVRDSGTLAVQQTIATAGGSAGGDAKAASKAAAAADNGSKATATKAQGHRQPFAIVQPLPDSSKLALVEDGLKAIEAVEGLVSPVGQAWMGGGGGGGGDEGFGVGHSRLTQTKGLWVWGQPQPVQERGGAGPEVQLLFFDTEGFESTGKADAYDDRIFALSALISQARCVLIYNLPESIRESDLEKLSFAVQLAAAFYSADGGGTPGLSPGGGGAAAAAAGGGGGEGEEPVRPGSMVWLIQRDFLRGKGLAQTLQDALQPVANPHVDPGLEQLNRIRLSLQQLARNSTAVGLPQPHLDRTRLCEMTDASLEPAYKREELRALVRQLAAPKVVTALNEREIPNAGSLVEYFNRELVAACTQLYIKRMEALRLPVEDKALLAASAAARDAAAAKFEREKFGRQVESLRGALDAALARELAVVQGANAAESARTCERAEMTCEEVLDKEARQRLPSMGRFETKYEQCAKRFRQACVGPALTNNLDRLKRAWEREHSRFALAYNERLLNGLMLLSLACIVAFRFVVRVQLGESLGWVAFIFLQVYPKTFLASEATMYDSAWWRWLVAAWEHVVFNPLLDLQSTGLPLGAVAAAAALTRRWWVPVARVWWARRRLRRRKQLAGALQEGRDLNV
eukprot:scaffold2.g7143.t1